MDMNFMATNIRRAENSCVEKIAPLFDAYRIFYGQPSDLPGSRDFLAERISHNESTIFYAQDESGEVLGFVQLYPLFSSVSARRTWLLNDLYTIDAARGRGIGSALLETAKKFAARTGAKGILLETGKDNISAQRLYEAQGYVQDTGYYTYFLDLA